MAGVTIKSNNLGKLAAKLPGLADLIVAKTTMDLEAEIKQNIVAVDAIDSGNMLNTTQGHHEPGSIKGHVDTAAEYWVHVEFGTHNMAGRPFVLPAKDAIEPGYHAAIKQGIERVGG